MALLHFLLLTSCAALEMGQEQFRRKVEVATPRWEASPTLRVQLYVCAVMCGIALVASLIFFYTSTPTSEVKEMKEGLETAEISEPAPEPEAVAEEPKNLGPALEEYEDLVRKLLQRGAQSMAPKVAKGVQVASILSDKVSSLTTKAKALVMTELTDTVGSVAQSLQLEDAALSANMPPISVLLAGLLVPVNLNFNIVCHLLQVVLVLIPVLCVAGYSEYADQDHPCASIPGLRLWARSVGVIAGLVALARLLQVAQCMYAKAEIRRKNDEMKVKLAEATAQPSNTGLEELKELFIFYASTLQHALACEARTRVNVFSHIVGFGTLLWVLTTFWNLWLYFGYLFVPGVVAFHPAAAGEPSYCAAWVTACAAQVSILLALLFFFGNVMTVFCWISETSLSMDSIAEKIVAQAKAFDQMSMGLPVAQILVKAVLLRGSTDVLCSRLAAQMREKDGLSQEMSQTEKQLAALKAELEAKNAEVDAMKSEMVSQGGYCAAQAERIAAGNLEVAKAHGAEVIEEARRKAAMLEKQTGEEIEKMLAQIKVLMEQAAAAADMAKQQAQEALAQAAEGAPSMADAQKMASEAMAQAADAAPSVAMAQQMAQGSLQEARAAAGEAAKKVQNLAA